MRLDLRNQTNQDRNLVINRIIHLVDIMNIKVLSGWEEINFSKITTLRNDNKTRHVILNILLEELEEIYQYRLQHPHENDYLLAVDNSKENWRLRVPLVLKSSISNWETEKKSYIELSAKDMLRSARGKNKKELTEFLEYLNSLPTISEMDVDGYFIGGEVEDEHGLESDETNFEEWRRQVPRIVRVSVPDWDIISLLEMEIELMELMKITTDKDSKDEIKIYLSLLEDFIYQELNATNLEEWRRQAPRIVRVSVPEWYTISLSEMEEEVVALISITKNSLKDELEDYLGIIDDFLMLHDEDDSEEAVDQLAVIAKYRNGAVSIVEETKQLQIDDSWRKLVPTILKQKIKEWKTAPIHSVYDQAKEVMQQNPSYRDEIMPFVVELSQIIFDQNEMDDEEIQEEPGFSDEISDSIMSLVEMIILPHLEVLDLIQQRGGKITFSNLWNKPFNEELKIEVKDRDGWKCVVCEAETDLHVHHKIPRDKGGIHHKENLVTLCASCHGAIETADIQLAFKKCLANYKKKKYSHISRQSLSQDKKLLKAEVENSLDTLLLELNNKEEHKLVEDVIGVMKRLEIIFYD